jgi:hypothetical protein
MLLHFATRRFILAAIAAASCAAAATHAGAQTVPLLPGDLVVTVYGDANTPETTTTSGGVTSPVNYVDGNPTPISLEEFSTTIATGIDNPATTTPLLSESLPDAGTGNNVGIVGEYGSSSEGTIQLSGNGQYLSIGGYDGNVDENGAPNGGYSNTDGTALGQSTDTAVPRVAGLINIATGAVDTSTVLNDVYNGNNPRSVYTPDGTNIYLSGQGAGTKVNGVYTDQGGIYTTTTGNNTTSGGTTPTGIYNGASTRTVMQSNINATAGGTSTGPNLYYSMDQDGKGVDQAGVFEYSPSPTGNQASNGIRITAASGTLVPGGPTVNFSPSGFFFANSTTLYVADTGAPKAGGTGDGGIQKWSFSSANQTWILDYTLTYKFSTTGTESGFASLTGEVVDGTVDLYATSYTTADDAPDGLYGVADTLSATTDADAADAVVQLAASGPDMDYKGVVLIPAAAPEPSTWALMLLGGVGLAFWKLRRRNRAA